MSTVQKKKKKSKKIYFYTLFFIGITYYLWGVISPALPKASDPIIFYSNQSHSDLRLTMLKAIRNAEKSLHMITFGLSDNPIISAILKKHQEKLRVRIFYDKRSSPFLSLPKSISRNVKSSGLIHQKILVLDEKQIFIGSANMTTSSLSMHDNLVVGFYSTEIAHFLISKTPFSSGHMKTMVGGQDIELWLLPDVKTQAINGIKNLIRSAKKNIKITMFTLTHPILIEEIIKARKRNVNVEIYLDHQSALSASKKAYEKLKKADITIKTSRGPQLLHHKYAYIDNKTLVTGSTNWTKSAFKRNKDCFFILHNLTHKQRRFMNHLQDIIEKETR